MKLLTKISENVFLYNSERVNSDLISLIESCSLQYSFQSVDRRPHLTMEFPSVFDSRDSLNALSLREIIYSIIMPVIKEYMQDNNISSMYPKKDFITISKLMPGPGMGAHVDNPNVEGNHFICMVYLNDNFEGGELFFPKKDIKHKPKAGDVLIYKASLEHEVLPVISGIRYSIGYGLTDDPVVRNG